MEKQRREGVGESGTGTEKMANNRSIKQSQKRRRFSRRAKEVKHSIKPGLRNLPNGHQCTSLVTASIMRSIETDSRCRKIRPNSRQLVRRRCHQSAAQPLAPMATAAAIGNAQR